ncbi:hypothetical protein LDL08_21870 [Nonomuraea glycinis]|uniref:SDR family NAD(P)-dependent oxidoreductase n=1 Tax=Nonomuraea glycinis TaxID=2047744 RepID=A0A918E540_9ACTN|nr:hypothetical protein [Nonomuraea glycinis]MCA2178841.1 hypothetical protein [Nonomuraea glycinis]GGP08148.1 hypothetical protein GCM10012278_38700 [Nonomuraea glycinis]
MGSDPAKGRRFAEDAERLGAGERAAFIRADLTSVAENRRVIEEVRARHDRLDGLVLTAMRHFRTPVETADGFEVTFALYYVSRFLLSHGLTGLLAKAETLPARPIHRPGAGQALRPTGRQEHPADHRADGRPARRHPARLRPPRADRPVTSPPWTRATHAACST